MDLIRCNKKGWLGGIIADSIRLMITQSQGVSINNIKIPNTYYSIMQSLAAHPDISDFAQVSQQFCLINLQQVERQSTIQLQRIFQVPTRLNAEILPMEIRSLIDSNLQTISQSVDYLNQLIALIKYSKKWEVQYNYCNVFKKTHYIRMEQLFMILNIFRNYEDPEFMKNLSELYVSIKGFEISPRTIKDVNTSILQIILKFQQPYLTSFKEMVLLTNQLFIEDKFTEAADGVLGLKVIHSKIYTLCQIFPSACLFPEEDILNPSQKKLARWVDLNKRVTYQSYGTPQAIHSSFEKLKQQIIWANTAMNTMTEAKKLKLYKPDEMLEYVKKGIGLIGLLFLKQNAKKEAQRLQSEPDPVLAKKIFNMTDEGITKQMLKVVLPQINFSTKIFIQRKLNYITKQTLKAVLEQEGDIKSLIEQRYKIQHPLEYRNNLVKSNPNNLLLRINSPTQIQYKSNPQPTFLEKINGFFKQQAIVQSNVVLHIHGGGFISMSSYSHQIYTRKWANDTGTPFISVDYAKAPEFPYPAALNDCLQAYLWILNAMPQIYESTPTKIYLVGDSAGGNLVAALTLLLIRLKLKVPDGIFMVYPALNINSKLFTPSLLHSLQDFILPHTYLKICARSYIQEYVSEADYLLSPILAPSEMFKQFPLTRIYVGSEDPFHDDCFRLTEKLSKEGVDVHLTVYQNFGHGFLQFDNMVQPIYEARKAVDEIGKHMKFVIERNK